MLTEGTLRMVKPLHAQRLVRNAFSPVCQKEYEITSIRQR